MDRPMRNIAWLSLTALLESLQLIIIIALIFSFIPIPPDDFYPTIFAFFRKGLYQKRDMLYYRIFIFTAIALQAVLVLKCRRFLNDEGPMPKVRAWIAVSALFLIPQLCLIYQFWLGPHPQEARLALCAVGALALASKVFWPEIYSFGRRMDLRRFWAFRSPSARSWGAFWKRHQDTMILCLLTSAIGIQVYLYAQALYGWRSHIFWPSAHGWGLAVGVILTLGTVIAVAAVGISRGWAADFRRRYRMRTSVECLLAFFLLNALFKIHCFYWQPLLAQRAYEVLLAVSLGVKIFWPWIERFLKAVAGLMRDHHNRPALRGMVNVAFVVFIFLFLYVPDLEAAIARVFMGEQFHGVDSCLMNAGWAYHSGCKLDVDVNNRYGLGMAVMTSWLCGLPGGFTYLHVYAIVMLACIIYFVMAYGLLRWWLKSISLAIAGTLMALKMQPFHEETSSFYLTTPSQTVCRYFFDIPFLFLVLLFLRKPRKYFLFGAALVCAIALFYAADTGVYLTCAYYAFLVMIYTFKDLREKIYSRTRDLGAAAALVLIPPLGAFSLLFLTQGPAVLTAGFWQNMTEYARSQMWYGSVHIWVALLFGEGWLFGMAMWVIILYVFTMLFIGTLVYLKKIPEENFFVVVLCIYGLALDHYYINRSTLTTCYKVIIPYIFILCFWVRMAVGRLGTSARRKFSLIFLALCFYALWTTHLTLAYPNVFNFSRDPAVDPLVAVKQSQGRLAYFNFLFIEYPDAFKLPENNLGEVSEEWRTEDDFKSDEQLKEYFRQEFNFPEDAALIDSLTRPDEPVALISSFEIQMLIQADRKPFFYIFPLVNSRPMRMRLFEVTHMWTTTQAKDTLKQLEDKQPPFVFMERIYLARVISSAYLYDMPAICVLDNYVRQHYEPYMYGKYLVAMKLKKG
jgi:hypothetical protein